ncbi:hypothetical protein BDR04DRAFT_1117029 [Suillus decipiens]|nr:hypothetical protein BDR04DRAFT_1117029 [Suillus decipiens]
MSIIIDSVNMLEDVIFLDIDNVVPSWDTYCFALDINSPGRKRIVLRFRDAQILQLKNGRDEEDNSQEGSAVQILEDESAPQTLEDEEEELAVQTSEDEEEELVVPVPTPLSASPCILLTRRLENPNADPENPTAPWRYCMRPINESHLSAKTKKRDADEQELQERFKKPRGTFSSSGDVTQGKSAT